MRNRWFIAVAIAALCAAGCRRGAQAPAPGAEPPGVVAAAVKPPPDVGVSAAVSGAVTDEAVVTGSLSAVNDVTVGVKSAGKVVAVYGREGDPVRAGQVVAQQDTTDLQNQLEQARANLLAARTKLDQSHAAYRAAQTNLTMTSAQTDSGVRQAHAALVQAQEQAALVKAGSRPEEIQQAVQAVAEAKANRDQARADLKRYRDLYIQQAVSGQQLDQAQAAADGADARYSAATAALAMAREGSRVEDIRRSQAAVDQANQTLLAAQAGRDQVMMRRTDVMSAQAGIAAAQAGVDQAAAAVRVAEKAVADATVRSPITGIIAARKVEPGMQVAAAKPDVMEIVGLSDIYFDAQLSEKQYSEVRVGQPVSILVDALPGRTFAGTVSHIFPVASAASRIFTVRISIHNEGRMLRPQMFARGSIVLARHAGGVLVPRAALVNQDGDHAQVFVVAGGKAHARKVATGIAQGDRVEVLSGVRIGDSVVINGQQSITDGEAVHVLAGLAPGT